MVRIPLVDAIECGIVKVLRVPVADVSMTSVILMYRHLWAHVKDVAQEGAQD